MARPLKPFVRSGGYYPSAKYTPLVYPGGYTTLNAKNGKPEPLNTFVGKIVQFLAKRSLPMVKLEANFTPIQNLNGYEAPWPAGGGKNLFDKDAIEMDKWIDVGSTTISTANGYAVTDYIPVTQGTIYYFGAKGSARSAYYDSDKNGIEYFAYNGGSAFTAQYTGFMRFTLYAVDMQALVSTLQFEKGNAATAYAPYSNICPISGHTGCEINRTGKNLLDAMEPGTINQSTGQNDSTSSSYSRAKGYIGVVPGQTYTIGKFSGSANFRLFYYGSDKSYLGTELVNNQWVSAGLYKYTFTAADNVHFIRFQSVNTAMGNYINTMQVEPGSTASDYEEFSGTTVSISFGTTVYGGKLTVFEDGSGQVVADRVKYTITADMLSSSNLPTKEDNRWRIWFANQLYEENNNYKIGICNKYVFRDSYAAVNNSNNSIAFNRAHGDQILVRDDTLTTKDEVIASITNQSIECVYPLATPVTIPLTPGQIQTLVSENVVWVNNSDYIQVTAYGTEIV